VLFAAAVFGARLAGQDVIVRSAPSLEMASGIDSNSPAYWRDGRLVWFGSHGNPWRNEGPNQFGPFQRTEVTINSVNPWPKWLESIWPEDNGVLWGWYHAEPGGMFPDSTLTVPRVGAMMSLDGGNTFQDLGVILETGEAPNTSAQNGYFAGGHGDPCAILDRQQKYFYFFFGNYGGAASSQGVCIARMAFEDRANPDGKVWKYYNGTWQEAGRGGRVTPIFPVTRSWATRDPDAFWGAAVHWNTYLNCYVMLLNHAQGEPGFSQEGVYVSFSPDLSRPELWTTPRKIVDKSQFSGWYFFYPQVMGYDQGDTDRRTGRLARLWINGVSKWEIEFVAPETAPDSLKIVAVSASHEVTAGKPVTLSVAPMGAPPFTYQWFKDGVAIPGATAANLAFSQATVTDSGAYTVTVSNALGSATSNAFTLTVAFAPVTTPQVEPTPTPTPPVEQPPPSPPPPPPEAFLSNLSVRSVLPASSPSMTVGFVVRSETPKPLLLRAIGPTLGAFGVPDSARDPRLTVFNDSANVITANDDWLVGDAPAFAAAGAFPLSSGSADAAAVVSVPAGPGTAVLKADGGGVVLAEIYDTAASRNSKVVNLSALALVGSGAHIMIGGFTVSGEGTKRVLIRALGPQLAAFGVANALQAPVIDVYENGGALVATNSGWNAELIAAFASAGAAPLPAGSADAAVVLTVTAGSNYSALVRSGDGSEGEALLEVYELP
jgi:hypothetical protein